MKTINTEWVGDRVAYLLERYEEGDVERSHADEDELVEIVIRELALASELAAALLPLLDADRTRWYA